MKEFVTLMSIVIILSGCKSKNDDENTLSSTPNFEAQKEEGQQDNPFILPKGKSTNPFVTGTEQPENPMESQHYRHTPSYDGCESGHWVESVSDDGSIVKLEDGSIWEISAADTVDTIIWLPTTDIVSCDERLINTEDNETVDAIKLR